MKKILIINSLLIATFSLAQVAIGKDTTTNSSVSLEFADNQARGLILPWVTGESIVTSAVEGTIIFDLTDKK